MTGLSIVLAVCIVVGLRWLFRDKPAAPPVQPAPPPNPGKTAIPFRVVSKDAA